MLPDEDELMEELSGPTEYLTEEELEEIDELCQRYPVVAKLMDRYQLLFSDPAKEFYSALSFASKRVSDMIFTETLDIDNSKHKAMMAVLEKGGTYYKSLQAGKEKAGTTNEDTPSETKPPVKRSAEGYAKRN